MIKNLIAVGAGIGVFAPITAQLPETLPIVALSGFAGGIVRMLAVKEKLWPHGLGTILTGLIVSIFLWPIGEPFVEGVLGQLEMDPIAKVMFGGFVTGLMGVSLIGLLFDIMKVRRGAVLPKENAGEHGDVEK